MADKTGNTYTIAKTAAWHIRNKANEMLNDVFVFAWFESLTEKGMTEQEARQKIAMLAIEKVTDWMLNVPKKRKNYTYRCLPSQVENFKKMREALEKKQALARKAKEKAEKEQN